MNRAAGVLLPISSLPSSFGIGDFGPGARQFIDFLAMSQIKLWQICPLTHAGIENSPYICYSAFAGNPLLIDLTPIIKDIPPVSFSQKINYQRVARFKDKMLRLAFESFHPNAQYHSFCQQHKFWLDDYSLFMALMKHFKTPWHDWPNEIKFRQNLKKIKTQLASDITYYKFIQFTFYQQWELLKHYAHQRGIQIVGDIPVFVSYNSADVWSNPQNFLLDKNLAPTHVAGVPPDYFSATGQLWGNPLYHWKQMQKNNFRWWRQIFKHQTSLYDVTRIDHFRGFESFWKIPAGEKTAINGHWEKAPGRKLLTFLKKDFPSLPFIAEDLGAITPEVEKLRDDFKLPGMKILQFAFDSAENEQLRPYTYSQHCIVYTGTHDNDTTKGWFKKLISQDQELVLKYLSSTPKQIVWSMIRAAFASPANWAIIPIQDLLNLKSSARLNWPGKLLGNYRWRVNQAQLSPQLATKIKELVSLYGRGDK